MIQMTRLFIHYNFRQICTPTCSYVYKPKVVLTEYSDLRVGFKRRTRGIYIKDGALVEGRGFEAPPPGLDQRRVLDVQRQRTARQQLAGVRHQQQVAHRLFRHEADAVVTLTYVRDLAV